MTANSLIINDLDNQGELPEPGKAEGGTGERGRRVKTSTSGNHTYTSWFGFKGIYICSSRPQSHEQVAVVHQDHSSDSHVFCGNEVINQYILTVLTVVIILANVIAVCSCVGGGFWSREDQSPVTLHSK